ncbi:phosphoribosylformylglycinamidine cyclo-ligase [Calorimonas adulescens]|uniref:Phosphoribosylformylglycinamidine cyclo-ligase n=1 Tax=Calorimonas adulescens TaxID=2606906 RepID=A0A5D8QH03_9THEO|nr:phosphoribosylformylglycinamidine cyclo-ligase [Calorimonas adulescens]TZE82548.1 phosphoribosylformylglycinamidine cyclo-ligase [Calorimonas adulescens]
MDYRKAGVNIDEGNRLVEMIKPVAKETYIPGVMAGVGGFAGLFELSNMKEPVLVSGTDGVGTKLKVAFMADRYDTIGIDLVAMCVNDVVCSGARPVFFLDYFATSKLDAAKAAAVIRGIADGCKMAGCALLGGETAELPDFYSGDEFDLAGFAVGVVEKNRIITGRGIKEGDIIIGLPSSGLHSNGFSLARKVLFEKMGCHVDSYIGSLGTTLGEELLKPTRIYVRDVLELIEEVEIKGVAHITGGGFYDNIPRILPDGLGAIIRKGTWPVQPIFYFIGDAGEIEEREMFRTFNMGIGLILITSPESADKVLTVLDNMRKKAYIIGNIVRREGVEIV